MKENPKILKRVPRRLLLFMAVFFIGIFTSNLVSAQAPACNITGPLKACTSESQITINTDIEYGTSSPEVAFSFSNNTSGASILSTGTYSFDATSGKATQSLIVHPGNQNGTFNIRVNIQTPDGKSSTCSKSVTVVLCESKMGKQ